MYQPPNPRNRIGKFFLFPFFRFGYEMLLLIDYFLLGRFRFDSFLFWVLGFSIKMFVDICFCFVLFFLFFYCQFRDLDLLPFSPLFVKIRETLHGLKQKYR